MLGQKLQVGPSEFDFVPDIFDVYFYEDESLLNLHQKMNVLSELSIDLSSKVEHTKNCPKDDHYVEAAIYIGD